MCNSPAVAEMKRSLTDHRLMKKVTSTLLCLGVFLPSASAHAAVTAAIGYFQKPLSVASRIADLDTFLARDSLFQAIKKVDPAEYRRFRSLMIRALQSGKSQQEIDLSSGQFGNDYLQLRLKRASPATLKKYLRLRADFMGQMAAVSPALLYSMVISGRVNTNGVSEKDRGKIGVITEKLTDQMAVIVLAPSSTAPLPQNDARTKRHVIELRRRMTAGELAELDKAGKPGVNPERFCKAYLKFYRECLKLPDVEMVQTARFIGFLPEAEH